MNVYQGLNLVDVKGGIIYNFNFPTAGQSYSDVLEVLENMKKQVQELETNSKKPKPSDAVPEVPKKEKAA